MLVLRHNYFYFQYLKMIQFFFRWVNTEGEKYDIEYNVKMRDMQVSSLYYWTKKLFLQSWEKYI